MHIKLNKTWREKLFFTSDTHYGHKNIMDYCDRPFETVEEMNGALIEGWNSIVPKDGLVFHLGDIAIKEQLANEFLKKVNGTVILIKGNHDSTVLVYTVNSKSYKTIKWKYGYKMLEIVDLKVEDPDIGDPGARITLCHYPMATWNYNFYGAVQLYGHVHTNPSTISYYDATKKQLDVGVDNNDFKPWTYIDIMKKFTKKALKK